MTEPDLQRPSIRTVAEALTAGGATGQIRVLPDSARTAAEAAAALGCEVGAIASSLVFDSDGEAVLVVTSGAHRVRRQGGGRSQPAPVAAGLTRLRPLRHRAGDRRGGAGGHPAPVRTFVDHWLDRHDVVWAAGGHPHAVFPTTYDELVRLTGGTPIDVE